MPTVKGFKAAIDIKKNILIADAYVTAETKQSFIAAISNAECQNLVDVLSVILDITAITLLI